MKSFLSILISILCISILLTNCNDNTPRPYKCQVYFPTDYNKASIDKWPMIFYLHGAGQRGNDLEKVSWAGPHKILEQKRKLDFIIIAPQCPPKQWWNDSLLYELLIKVIKEYPVDTSRIYLTGQSMGGYTTWSLAMKHPEKFAAIAPISAGGNPSNICNLKIPVWAFHGKDDDVVSPEEAIKMTNALKKCGGNVKFTLFPNTKHDAWKKVYLGYEIYNWFAQQKKSN